MRSLPNKRSRFAKGLKAKLKEETDAIGKAADPKAEAERRYDNARQTLWFKPVVDKLKRLSGKGQRCMYCSGSEASDVEHYRPKAVFPTLAMTWENYLWICTPCNRHKGNRFPPITEPGGEFVNPLQEDVWRFFFIDEFGFLSPLYRFDVACLCLTSNPSTGWLR
ncbi:MAG: HNH endonuclease [Verrucomicrobiota bacterium]